MALPLLAQVFALSLVCLCGGCPTSKAWGFDAVGRGHSCCHDEDEAPAAIAEASPFEQFEAVPCGCADHTPPHWVADRDDPPSFRTPGHATLAVAFAAPVEAVRTASAAPRALTHPSRGPPTLYGPAVFLRLSALLI